jgi:glycosyltransferase involved in cell wall biosynthesis
LLVPAGDAPAITAALQRLVDRPEDWPVMGREGRAHVEEHHDAERLAPRLVSILRGAA